jgi:lipoate-protein ligase B
MKCRIRDLGLIDFSSAYQLQQKAVQDVLKTTQSQLLVCEHPSVFTLGRRGKEDFFRVSLNTLRHQKIPVVRIDRGGEVTFHGLGQIVVYPIFYLHDSSRDLKTFLRKLEEVVIDLLKYFGIVANRQNGYTGVWVGSKKIASLGIGVKKWVTYHGVGLNVNTDLSFFSMIKPCGLDVVMTSIARELGARINQAEVKRKFIECFKKEFQIEVIV